MAINGRQKADVLDDTNNVASTELEFRTGLDDVIDQVDTTQTHMAHARSITLDGDISGSVSYELNDANDYAITITTNLNAGQIMGADIANSQINSTHIIDGTIVNADIANNTITADKIATGSKRRLRILNAAGNSVLFEIDGLIP